MGEKIKILRKKKLKKWTFEKFWTHFEVLYNKQSSEFVIPAFHDYSLGPKITKCGDPLYCGFSPLANGIYFIVTITKTTLHNENIPIMDPY